MKHIRNHHLFILVFSIFSAAYAEERTWTNTEGKSFVGDYVSHDDSAAIVRTKGKDFEIPLTKLSEQDREWLAEKDELQKAKNAKFLALAGKKKTYPANEKHQVTFHVQYPSKFTADNPRPLLILFSPGGNGKSMVNKFREPCEKLGWIAVGCDTFKNGVDASELDPLFEELLPVIEETVPHDPDLLYLGGFSGGASRAFWYTAKFDRPWKGVVSCGGWLGENYDLKYPRKMAVAWVNGDEDKNANEWIAKDTAYLDGRRRCKTETFHFPGKHAIAPPETLLEALTWIQEETHLPKK